MSRLGEPGRDGALMEEIVSEDAFEACVAASYERPVFLFKHSTACPVSAMAYDEVASYLENAEAPAPVYLVKVIESRPISNVAAEWLGLRHASPQLILIKRGEPVWHTSHSGIRQSGIAHAVAEAVE